jgi:putative transcriptional regulator
MFATAMFATIVADAPLAANIPGGTNRGKAFYANSQATPAILPIQSKDPEHLGLGKMLVASRHLGDPNFAETVILLVQYDEGGVVGLVLNHRTKVPLSRALDGNQAAKDLSDPLYLGGPVDPYSAQALLKSSAKLDGAKPVFDGVNLVASKALFNKTLSARTAPNAFRVYLGYAGWHKEQLQKEVELGAWFIFPADAGTVFNSDPDSLWPEMIRKTEMKFAENQPALVH